MHLNSSASWSILASCSAPDLLPACWSHFQIWLLEKPAAYWSFPVISILDLSRAIPSCFCLSYLFNVNEIFHLCVLVYHAWMGFCCSLVKKCISCLGLLVELVLLRGRDLDVSVAEDFRRLFLASMVYQLCILSNGGRDLLVEMSCRSAGMARGCFGPSFEMLRCCMRL